MRHPGVREDLRGTYAGLASEAAIEYLTGLGVTAVELLPIHHIADESFLAERGLTNYWGYSTIGYLAPHSVYAATGIRGQEVREFKGMVKALHHAGIEVILDVVYNHTAEGNHLGPMLAFKGVDNQSYYRLVPDDPHFYMDFTGTGNSLNPVHPSVLRLIMDSLRYWVDECHVDGFRFDLASALARELYDVDRLASFFDVIHQDPILSQVKLIAEPWDVGPGGYQVGNFPVLWSEWNGIYRDVMRDFWRGQAGVNEFAARFTGSSDLYESDGRHAVRVDQLHHRARRLHAPRPRLLQREAQRGEPRGQPRRDRRQPLVEHAASRGRPTTRRSSRCASASSATSSPRCSSRRARRCCSAATRWAARRAATTTPGARTTRSPGSTGTSTSAGSDAARVHPPADRAAPRAPGVPPPPVPARPEERGLGPARRLVVPARRAADDQARLGERARRRRCSSTARRSPAPDEHGERVATTRSCCCSTRSHEDVEFMLPHRALRRAAGSCELTTADAERQRGGRAGQRRRARRACPRCSLIVLRRENCVAPLPRDLPAAARPATWASREARELRPVPARPRRQPPVPAAVVPGAAGVDARLRRRRPDAHLGGARRRGGVRRARGAARAGRASGVILDIVPNHMATDDANRYWADPELRAKFFDIDERDRAPPALLRHRPPRRRPAGGPGGLRGDAPLALRLVARGRRRRAAGRPPRRAGRPGRLPARLRDGGAEHVWVEKILDPGEPLRDWPVEGTVGYEFLNDVAALFVDPAGEAPLTDLWAELAGDDRPFGELAFEAKLEQATRAVRARGRAPARARRRATSAALERALVVAARLPHLRRAVARPRRGRRPRGARATPGCPSRCARADARGARLGRVRHALPADDAADHGQGRRGHRVLPLRAAARAQRRRRRPERASASRSTSSTPANLERARALPAQPADHADARHQALGRRARADRRAGRRWPTSGRRTCAAGSRRARRCAGRRRASSSYFVFQTLRRRLADRARTALEAYMEKALREAKRNTNWIEPDDALRGPRQGVLPRAVRAPAVPGRLRAVRRARSRAAGDRAALGQLLLKLTVPGVPDIYQGDELRRALARRPRQPPPGRLGRAAASCSPRSADGAAPTRETRKLWLIVRALDAARAAARGVRRLLRAASTPATDVCAFVRGGEVLAVAALRATCRGGDRRTWRDVPPGEGLGGARRSPSWSAARDHVARAHRPVGSRAARARPDPLLGVPADRRGRAGAARAQAVRGSSWPRGVEVARAHARRRPAARRGGPPRRRRAPRARADFPKDDLDAFIALGRAHERRHARARRSSCASARLRPRALARLARRRRGRARSRARFGVPWLVTVHATEYGRHQGWVDKHPQSHIHARREADGPRAPTA